MRRIISLFSLTPLLVLGQVEDPFLAEIPPPTPPAIPKAETASPFNADGTLPSSADPLANIIGKSNNRTSDKKEDKPTIPSYLKIQGENIQPTFSSIDGKQVTRFNGRIQLTADTLQAFADDAIYHSSEGYVKLIGNVSVYREGLTYRGESAIYYPDRKEIDTSDLRLGLDPILMEAGGFRAVKRNGRNIYIGENSGITTHDVKDPAYWIRSKKTTFIPGDKVIFKDLTLEINDRKLFWLPYLSQPLDANIGYLAIPGARSNLGFFLKNRYGVLLGGKRDPDTGENESAWLLSQWNVDFYGQRGVGLGVDLFDTRLDPKDKYGWLKFYYIYDTDANSERAGLDRENVSPDRYRVEFNHRIKLWQDPIAKYTFDTNLTWISDEFFLEDFDPKQFRINDAPDNWLGFTRRSANSQTALAARLRLNDFYQSDTRLPELTHDWIRQPFLGSSVLYESQTTLGIYEEEISSITRDTLRDEADSLLAGDPRLAEIDSLLDEQGFARIHTYHEFSLPHKIGELNIVPRLGAGHTAYTSIQGPSDTINRTHFSAAVDLSTKLSKNYPNLNIHNWGLKGARHIIQPYASLSWLSTDEFDASFSPIDRLTATTRPRPQQVGRFTAVDELQDWSILRIGTRNRIVTLRDGRTHDWLTLDTYFDTFFEDPEFDRNFSNLYNDLTWDPVPWFALAIETQIPLFSDSNFTEFAGTLRFMPDPNVELDISYRHLNDHPILSDSDRLTLESFLRLNEYWGIGTYHRFEFEDSTLELQQYNIHYDFDSFVGSIGFFHRNNRIDDEFGVTLSFGIKEIPSLSLPIDFGAQSF